MFELRLKNNTLHVVVSHQGEEIWFKVSSLGKSGLNINQTGFFTEINGFLSQLDHKVQYQLYRIYKDIRELRDDVGVSFRVQQAETKAFVKQIYDIIKYESLQRFMITQTHIAYPSNLLSVNDQSAYTPALNVNINYFLEDYKELTVLVVALRPMVPIWAEYLDLYSASTGSKFKEQRAFQLLGQASLSVCKPMERLRLYVDEWRVSGNKKKELKDNAGVLDSVSSESLTDFLLSKIMVRKLSVVNVSARSDKESIISSVYNYLNTKITETSKDFATYDKKDDNGINDNETEESVLEKYKISTKITHGDIAFIVQYARNPVKFAYDIDPTVPPELVQHCVEHNLVHGITPSYHLLTISQWVINKVLPARAIIELPVKELILVTSMVQAILIHWGFVDLAVILTGRRNTSRVIASSLSVSIDAELLKKLDIYYPYTKPTTRNKVKPNVAHTSVITMSDYLMVYGLEINPPPVIRDIPEFSHGTYSPLPTVINSIAGLLVKINENL